MTDHSDRVNILALQHRLRIAVARDLDHGAAELFAGGHVFRRNTPWPTMPVAPNRITFMICQAYVEMGRYRLIAPIITMTKNTSTMPWTTANGGSAGGTLGASACSAGTFRNDWITSTNTLR